MANLYNIQKQYLRFMELIEEAEGEMTDDVKFMLNQLEQHKDELIESILMEVQNNESFLVTLKSEVERLNERKATIQNRIDRNKRSVIDILKFFNMKSTTRNAKNYAFNSAAFQCFTVVKESYALDDTALFERFKPITGEISKFIGYTVDKKFNADELKELNKTNLVPVTDYNVVVDKVRLNRYLTDIKKGVQLEISTEKEAIDPIASIAKLQVKESLTIR